jgi:hypothetical protein
MADAVDFVVKSPDNETQLVVEATSSMSLTKNWPAHMRRNLLQHTGHWPHAYFILARPDRLFIWEDGHKAGTVQPDNTLDTKEVLGPYLNKAVGSLGGLSGESFEIVVRTWLEDVVSSGTSLGEKPAQLTGLYNRIKNGTVTSG